MSTIVRYLYIGLGGALGALTRWGVATMIVPAAEFPLGTLVVNLTGCLLIGFLFPYTLEAELDPNIRLGIITGFIGAYTTFSTWESGAFGLLTRGHVALGLAYLAASILGGLLCTISGTALARKVVAGRRQANAGDA